MTTTIPTLSPQPGNPLATAHGDALLDMVADAVADRVVSRLVAEFSRRQSAPPEPSGLLDKRDAAKMLGVSMATVDRMTAQGMPTETIGARRRFDVPACRAWLKARGRSATTPARSERVIDVDVDDVIASAGLRRAAL
jgi:hypothetical protein